MVRTFTRKENMSPGQRDTGDYIEADDINKLQQAAEDLQTGALPIALAGIEGALGEAGAVRTGATGTDGQELRWSKGAPAYVKQRSVHLNDKADVDPTGTDPMGDTISTYLAEFRTVGNIGEVISDTGSTYLIDSTPVSVPAGLVWEGGNRLDLAASEQTCLKATTGATTLIDLPESYVSLRGLKLDGDNATNVVLIAPQAHYLQLEHMHLTGVPSGGAAIKGGGILYLSMDYCLFNGSAGRGLDLLLTHYTGGGSPYYGVNTGQITRSFFYGASEGPVRFDGILTFRDCDFEHAYPGSTGVIEVGGSVNGHLDLGSSYFELSGSNAAQAAVYLTSAASLANIHDNVFYGPTGNPSGMAAVRFGGPLSFVSIRGNEFYRWDTAIANIFAANGGGVSINGNGYISVTTRHTFNAAQKTSTVAGTDVGGGLIGDTKSGMAMYGGSIQGSLVYYSDPTNHSVVDLARGNVHHFEYSGACSPTITNARPGMTFICRFVNANATLTNSTWHVVEATNTAPSAGTSRQFYVDYFSVAREVGV